MKELNSGAPYLKTPYKLHSRKERQLFDENILKQEIDVLASFCTLLETEPSSLFIHLDTSECLDISRGYR